jgi:hypothetical protein
VRRSAWCLLVVAALASGPGPGLARCAADNARRRFEAKATLARSLGARGAGTGQPPRRVSG